VNSYLWKKNTNTLTIFCADCIMESSRLSAAIQQMKKADHHYLAISPVIL
jgi:hypothetical protein